MKRVMTKEGGKFKYRFRHHYGRFSAVYVVADTEKEARQKVTNEFDNVNLFDGNWYLTECVQVNTNPDISF